MLEGVRDGGKGGGNGDLRWSAGHGVGYGARAVSDCEGGGLIILLVSDDICTGETEDMR